MLLNIADIDKIELFIELNNIVQASPFGQGNIIKDQDTAKKMLAEKNNDYSRFDLYCDISKDTVDTHTFNNLYGDGSAIFEKIVSDLRAKKNGNTLLEKVAHVAQVAQAAPVVVGVFFSAPAGDVKLAKEQQTSKPDASASASAPAPAPAPAGEVKLSTEHSKLSEPVSVSSDVSEPKKQEELTDLQQHARALIEKLTEMRRALRSQLIIQFKGTTPRPDCPPNMIALFNSKQENIEHYVKNISITEKILKSEEISKDDRASLQTMKDDFDKHNARPSRTSAMIGTVLAILDAQSSKTASAAKP